MSVLATEEQAPPEEWMACSFEGFAVGSLPPKPPGPSVSDSVFVESSAFRFRVVRGRADDIMPAPAPQHARRSDRYVEIDRLDELYVPNGQHSGSQRPEWRAVRIRGARLYDLDLLPLDNDGLRSHSLITATLYFDANKVSFDAEEPSNVSTEASEETPSRHPGLGAWFVSPFTPLTVLGDFAVLAYVAMHWRTCPWGLFRFAFAYSLLRGLHAFAPLAKLRARVVRWAERTPIGSASLWLSWFLSSWFGIAVALAALSSMERSSCSSEGSNVLALAFGAATLLIAAPAQRFLAPAVFAIPLVFSALSLTCPATNPHCGGDEAQAQASPATSKTPSRAVAMPAVPCEARPPTAPADAATPSRTTTSLGSHEDERGNAEPVAGIMATLGGQGARLGSKIGGADSDEHALLEASGAGERRTTLDEAEAGDDPFRESSSIRMHGGHDAICGKPLFVPSSLEFERGSASLRPAGGAELRRIARLLVRHKDRTFIVAAHVPAGDGTNVDELSKARAHTVVAWLKAWPGLGETSFIARGLGNRDGLVDANGKDTIARLNDRIEIGMSCGDGPEPSRGPQPLRRPR